MKQMVYLAILALAASSQVFAQTNFDDEVSTELDRLYDQNQGAQQQGQQYVQQAPRRQQVRVAQQQYMNQPQGQLQTVQIAQPQIQIYKQPTTVIEASPLTESNAEKMRRARQESELLTEQKIVEKLESSRMEDEKKRAEVLFGDKFNQMNGGVSTAQNTTQQQAVVVPAATVVPAMDKDSVRNEVSAALEDLKAKDKKEDRKSFFSVSGGLGDYNTVKNVRGNYALGFSIGQSINDRLLVEGGFQFSNFEVEQVYDATYLGYPRITSMDVYQGSLALKYQILNGVLRPVVGGIAAYSYRTFQDTQFGAIGNNAQAHAIDLGLSAGADVVVSESFSLGLEYRYMMNVTSRVQNDGPQISFSQNSKNSIEKLNYSNILMNAKMTF